MSSSAIETSCNRPSGEDGVTSEDKLKASNMITRGEVVMDKNAYTVVKEGQAEVLFPSARDVFYNPVQEFNRDLSVSVLRLLAVQHQLKLREKLQKQRERQEKHKAEQSAQDEQKMSGGGDETASANGSREVEAGTMEEAEERPSPKEKAEGEERPSPKEEVEGEERPSPKEEEETEQLELKHGVRCETGLRVLEALAASGLRSCRFAREVGGLKEVVANDISAAAVDAMRRNVEHNGVQQLVKPNHGDACMLMYSERRTPYDVIDLDPYGSPAIFLDSAVQAVADGGVLQVTCTDMAILCGNAPETCHAKYGATSVRSKMCHEMALRIALQCIESHANRYGRYIEPLVSVSVDFYIRLFVRLRHSQSKVKLSASKLCHVLVCSGCDSWRLQTKCRVSWNGNNAKYHLPVPLTDGHRCPHCRFPTHFCGPIWSAPIHDQTFVDSLLNSLKEDELATYKRLVGVLSVVKEELEDVPLYYDAGRLASTCRLSVPPMIDLRSAFLNAGYRVSSSHCNAQAVKTDAPPEFVWDVVRSWDQLHPAKRDNIAAGSPAAALLATPPTADVSFTSHPAANPGSRRGKLLRFQKNPTANWGPKTKAKTSITHDSMTKKQRRNQGKKRRRAENEAAPPQPEVEESKNTAKRDRPDSTSDAGTAEVTATVTGGS